MTDDTRLRRLDALFAERVMGCKVIFGAYSVDGQKRGECGCPGHKHGEWDESDMSHYPTLPHYTRSLDAAWEGAQMRFDWWVLRKITSRGHPENDLFFIAEVGKRQEKGEYSADHPAEALVLASLRAVGVEESELQ